MAAISLTLLTLTACLLFGTGDGWCTHRDDCDSNEVCCNNECSYGSSCLGSSCTLNSDCSSFESCCNSVCKSGSDCIGDYCTIDSDCGSGEDCCYGSCSSACYDDPTPVIVGSIFGSLLLIFLISFCIFFACRRRRTLRHGRVIVGQRVTATTTTTRCATQTNPLYHGQVPPSYQQGYPYYPPPQYKQQQTAMPPRYNPAQTTASEQPPPYTAAAPRSSGRVYAPKPSYGAVPSAPPV